MLLINNMPTHHQLPLAQNLSQLLGDNFRFACYSPVSSERTVIGWKDFGKDIPWMIRAWESEEARKEYKRWLVSSDVVIGFPENWQIIKERLLERKLFLLATERPLKPSTSPLWGFPPQQRRKSWLRHVLSYYHGRWQRIQDWQEIDSPYCHGLAIGAYCPWDFQRLGVFKDRMWTYGYFNDVPTNLHRVKIKQSVQILWAGRMLKWKRVDILIKACDTLHQKKLDFHLMLIGDGPENSSLIKLVTDLGLQELISFHPPVNPQEVRQAMRAADIYVLPSSQEEGWGVVIGEAMSEGCAVIASADAGAAPLLIQHGKTGYLFPMDNVECLEKYLEILVANPEMVSRMGVEGWRFMMSTWSPEVAAERLLMLSEGLFGSGKMPRYITGPCSPVQLVKPGILAKEN